MRKTLAIAQATALEILSEPLTLLIFLAFGAVAVFAPTFHYHQFGEPTRMARDAGFSAILVAGALLAVFSTIRAWRREIETGTLEMALAHSVSRTRFFLSKCLGAFVSIALVMATLLFLSVVLVEGAAVGGRLAERTGDLARVWGPCVALAVAVLVLPLVLSAFLNRFFAVRFALSALLLALLLAASGALYFLVRDFKTLAPLFPAALPLFFLAALFTSAAGTFALFAKSSVAATWTGLFILLFLPFIGNYALSDALANGGSVTVSYVALSFFATLPALAAFLVLGSYRMTRI